jgi:hypothetical protein
VQPEVSVPTSEGQPVQPEGSVPPVGSLAAQPDVAAPVAEHQPSSGGSAQAVDGPASPPDGARQDETAQRGAWQGDEGHGGGDQGGQQEAQTAAG